MEAKYFAPGLQLQAQFMVPLCEESPPTSWLYEDLCEIALPLKQITQSMEAMVVLQLSMAVFEHINNCPTCGLTQLPPVELTNRMWFRNFHEHVIAHMEEGLVEGILQQSIKN